MAGITIAPVVSLLLLLAIVLSSFRTTLSEKNGISRGPFDGGAWRCRKGAGETCKPNSMRDCCKSGMECKSYPKPGTNNNSTGSSGSGTCCLAKGATCKEIGTGSCCPGFSCESSGGGLKCQQFLAEATTS